MKTLTQEEFKKKYGEVGLSSFSKPAQPKSEGISSGVKKVLDPNLVSDSIKSGVQKTKEGYTQARDSINNKSFLGGLGNLAEGSVKMTAGAIETAFSGLAPALKPISKSVDYIGDKISDNPSVQKFANSKAGERTSRITEDVSNLNTIFGTVAGGGKPKPKGVIKSEISAPSEVPPPGGSSFAQNVASEVIPTADRVVNHQVSRALDLTPGDLKNIKASTGNETGRFLADNNLIGGNKDVTVKNIDNFYKQNYDAVRSEIGKVKAEYNPVEIPRYKEALTAIKNQIKDTPGLQQANAEVNRLLAKEKPTLADVQRVKELMDEHFSLYKVTGDVKESVSKQGLAEIRKDLREWIETEVKDRGGADIKDLNNKVQTARSIADAIEARAPRGLTRSNLKLGDLGIFGVGMGMGGPLGGAALLFGKKIMESPTFRLKVSKWLDGLSDARKLQIQKDLENGKLPPEVKITQSNKNSRTLQSDVTKNSAMSSNSDFIDKSIPQKRPNMQGGFVKNPFAKKESKNYTGVKIGGKSVKEIPDATKKEMVEAIDYMRLKKPSSKIMEDTISRLQGKYGINPDWSNERIANAFEKLVEITKTK